MTVFLYRVDDGLAGHRVFVSCGPDINSTVSCGMLLLTPKELKDFLVLNHAELFATTPDTEYVSVTQ